MSKLSEKIASLSPKTRQYVMLGGASAGILALVVGGVSLSGNQPSVVPTPTAAAEQQATNIAAPGAAVDPREVYMTQSTEQMKQMGDVVQALKQQMAAMQASSGVPATRLDSILPPLPVMPPTVQAPPQLPPPIEQPDIPPKEPGIASFEVSQTETPDPEKDSNTGYVPAGSFVRVALLAGVEAPTGGQAQTNPEPILLRTQDNAFLPNRFRYDIKECFILASSYGDISSERAYARLENLSCVRRDGQAIDFPVKGYIVGEDGKTGMQGKLISKQGQVLANALLSGIGSGMGQAFMQNSYMNSMSPVLGQTQTMAPGQILQSGMGMGFGNALNTLSQYYITLANKL
ncbi:MAG: putative TraB pilus assembly, partial [Candidatus Gallionella acididurans]